jgi:hypothetical protein
MLLAALLMAGQAQAGWVHYGGTDTSTAYYEPSTIRKTAAGGMVWKIDDLTTEDSSFISSGWRSMRVLMDYRCAERQYRIIQATTHGQPMGAGEVIRSFDTPMAWSYMPPGSIAETLGDIVCAAGRKK